MLPHPDSQFAACLFETICEVIEWTQFISHAHHPTKKDIQFTNTQRHRTSSSSPQRHTLRISFGISTKTCFIIICNKNVCNCFYLSKKIHKPNKNIYKYWSIIHNLIRNAFTFAFLKEKSETGKLKAHEIHVTDVFI